MYPCFLVMIGDSNIGSISLSFRFTHTYKVIADRYFHSESIGVCVCSCCCLFVASIDLLNECRSLVQYVLLCVSAKRSLFSDNFIWCLLNFYRTSTIINFRAVKLSFDAFQKTAKTKQQHQRKTLYVLSNCFTVTG